LLMSAQATSQPPDSRQQGGVGEHILTNGIVIGHAYTLVRHAKVDGQLIVQLRNPWGQQEWNGRWCDNDCSSWTASAQRQAAYKPGGDDGLFWMSYQDCFSQFEQQWEWTAIYPADFFRVSVRGEWTRSTAGGCGNPEFGGNASWRRNPMYSFEIPEAPEPGMEFTGTLTLSQEDVLFTGKNVEWLPIGIKLYHDNDNGRLQGYSSEKTKYGVKTFSPGRDVSATLDGIEPGKYVLVPMTFRSGCLSKFFITVHGSWAVTLREM